MASEDALEPGEHITKFCCECRHFIPATRNNPEPKCKKFRLAPEATYGHSKPRKCSELRAYGSGDILCGPRAKGWQAIPDPWYKTAWEFFRVSNGWWV